MATVETPAFQAGDFSLRTALKGGVSNRSQFYDEKAIDHDGRGEHNGHNESRKSIGFYLVLALAFRRARRVRRG
ncbi:MAG: hypothetical protein LBI87_05435 [Candidatus Accumulibacter sp.]|nr:hypothetical protein [Accumulibacter sp.]